MRIFRELSLADIFTILNAISGFFGICYLILNGFSYFVFKFVFFSALMDGIDGFIANRISRSDMGRDLDSLADLISFGALPALILIRLDLTLFGILFFLTSILRLARFNVLKREDFLGLPTTASALFLSCLIILNVPFIQLFVLALSILMISDIEYKKVRNRKILSVVGIVIILSFFHNFAVIALMILLILYLISPIACFLKLKINI